MWFHAKENGQTNTTIIIEASYKMQIAVINSCGGITTFLAVVMVLQTKIEILNKVFI